GDCESERGVSSGPARTRASPWFVSRGTARRFLWSRTACFRRRRLRLRSRHPDHLRLACSITDQDDDAGPSLLATRGTDDRRGLEHHPRGLPLSRRSPSPTTRQERTTGHQLRWFSRLSQRGKRALGMARIRKVARSRWRPGARTYDRNARSSSHSLERFEV